MNDIATPENSRPRLMQEPFVHDFVQAILERRQIYLNAAKVHGSPLYLVEEAVLRERAGQFRAAFERQLPSTSFYYAMKSNNLSDVSRIVLGEGFGLDVSSGIELSTALGLGATDIIFSGPGKTDPELELAVENADRVTVLMDSPGECQRLMALVERRKKRLRVGLRLNHHTVGLWRKFGVPMEALLPLYETIKDHSYMAFKGVQFHSSWNLVPDRQVELIRILGDTLKKMPPSFFDDCEFIDIGGGYWPSQGEWLVSDDPLGHQMIPASSIETFAQTLGQVIREKILSLGAFRICFEPGRWICNDAMHIIIQVIDKKAPDLVITDAGTNAVGWERFETDYFPVINLTRSGTMEKPCHVLGSLCTPHDVWGYAYFGQEIREKDILMIPTQGAYTFSLRQEFIKPLPRVVVI
ncbi:LysA2 [Desulforapulum autotrophicum HRM2]|uniref:LysA2 n=1 Tax=Desulforapulum autotrophicum (strain ATCC 43914 / DSM 3382 / VKM B-1955 / HRM2) TaxID=177437 RepID=C0QL78_DESAH|nr:decarboxylase [Desulforapulum autotrophicum]ACN14164.1 LysA2 [Desulforapulum autotrophicum HRM2]